MSKPQRILYITRQYPQVTESYIETELRVLVERGYDVHVITLNPATDPRRETHAFRYIPQRDEEAVARAVREIGPDVVHGHELDNARRIADAARVAGVPFTIRTHSYDVLGLPEERMRGLAAHLAGEDCLGVLGFPFAREPLLAVGVDPERFHEVWPVLDYDRFHDRGPNGDRVMNLGACQPKKGMDQYVRLASELPERGFDLFAVGFGIDRVRALNDALGAPVSFMPLTEHSRMPAEYKAHEWLVYTAAERTVGWPVAVAEAQAAGVGVCMQLVREDIREYVGDAGYVFETTDELHEILSAPFSPERRELGFEHARRSDARGHVGLLERLWEGSA
jgi:hypothetical protein